MISLLQTSVIKGIEAEVITIETFIANGLPRYNIVGLPDTIVKESKERVTSAIKNSSIDFPYKKITQNLSPEDIKKEGNQMDLAIALGIISSIDKKVYLGIKEVGIVGALSLNGHVKGVRGILSFIDAFMKKGIHIILLPKENQWICSLYPEVKFVLVDHLDEFIKNLKEVKYDISKMIHNELQEKPRCLKEDEIYDCYNIDFVDVIGQEKVKRAVLIAVAGRHHMMIIGPPGCGKTMIGQRMITIMPNLTLNQQKTLTKIHSVITGYDEHQLVNKRQVIAPHSSITKRALIGGGINVSAGEIVRAHEGVLYLDELLEYKKDVIESLREPLSTQKIMLSRGQRRIEYPCKFLLFATANPCPCGYYGSSVPCTCTGYERQRYMKKLSGPMLDRIDIQVYMNNIELKNERYKKVADSKTMKRQILEVINRQKERFKESDRRNGDMTDQDLKKYCQLDEETTELLMKYINKHHLSMRYYNKVLKIARTLADIDGQEDIEMSHVLEAIGYRQFRKSERG